MPQAEALAMQAPLGLPSGSIVAHRYEVTGELGRGERSIVYSARDRRSGGDVALKLLALSPATAHFARQRLRRESEIVRALAHPGIVRPLEIVDHGSWSLIAMEIVSGRSLAGAVAAEGPLHPEAVARLGNEIADALSAAHRCGVVHHDLKPENILLDAGGRARLTDFGCARLEGQALLTLPEDPVALAAYLPPEVVEGQIANPRSDVYSLGLVLYFALVGNVPKGQRPNLPPPPLAGGYHPRERRADVPEWLDEIVARATRAEPGHRLETAERFGRALAQRSLESRGDEAAEGRALRVCVLCRKPGTLGRAVCPHCEDVEGGEADQLVMVVPARGRDVRANQLRLLSELTSIPAGSSRCAARRARSGRWCACPTAHADVLVKRLRGRGIDARALRLDECLARGAPVVAGASRHHRRGRGERGVRRLPAAARDERRARRRGADRRLDLDPARDAARRQERRDRRRPCWCAPVRAMPRLQVGQGRKLLIELLRIGRDLWKRLRAGETPTVRARSSPRCCCAAATPPASSRARTASSTRCSSTASAATSRRPDSWRAARSYHSARSRLVQAMLECAASLSRLRAQDMVEPEDERRALHAICFELREELESVSKQADEASQLFPGRPSACSLARTLRAQTRRAGPLGRAGASFARPPNAQAFETAWVWSCGPFGPSTIVTPGRSFAGMRHCLPIRTAPIWPDSIRR